MGSTPQFSFSPSPGGARNFEAYSFTECGALKPPPPPGSSFSSGRKGCKRPFRGSLWTPPKDPRLILPISALYQVRASRPSLRRLVRANCARSSAALWNFVPTLGLWGSSGSEMPSHFRKCARLRRALAVEQADHPARSFQAISRRPVYFHGRRANLL